MISYSLLFENPFPVFVFFGAGANVCVCIFGLNILFAFRYTIKVNACVCCACTGWLVGWLMINGKGDKSGFQSQCTHITHITQGSNANAF